MDHLAIRKALDLASGSASYMVQENIDPAIRDFISVEPVVANMVTKVPWATNTYYIRKRTGLPTATWRADGAALPAATNSTYTKVFKTMKFLYSRGEVTGPMQAAAGSLWNALAQEIEDHSAAMWRELSESIVTGEGDAEDITGMIYQIDNDDPFQSRLNGRGGTIDETGNAFTLAMLDEAIDAADADTILTSKRVRRRINALLQAQQTFTDRTEVRAGFRVLAYDDLPILTTPEWETATDILLFERSKARLLVQQDVTYEPLAKTKDSDDFMLKAYVGFALEGTPVHLTGFTGA